MLMASLAETYSSPMVVVVGSGPLSFLVIRRSSVYIDIVVNIGGCRAQNLIRRAERRRARRRSGGEGRQGLGSRAPTLSAADAQPPTSSHRPVGAQQSQ